VGRLAKQYIVPYRLNNLLSPRAVIPSKIIKAEPYANLICNSSR